VIGLLEAVGNLGLSFFSPLLDKKLAKVKCHINTILAGSSLALFPLVFKIKSFHPVRTGCKDFLS